MNSLNRLLTLSARQWHVSLRVAQVLFVAPWVLTVGLIFTRGNKPLFKLIFDEDRIVEWTSFGCFVLACVGAGAAAYLFWKASRKLPAVLYIGFALAMFFAAGEEIAWGQRIFNLKTPEKLEEINKQDELTLHNVGDTLSYFKIVMTVIGLGGAAAYLVNQRLHIENYLDGADEWMIPPFFLASLFFVVFVYRVFRYLVLRRSSFTITMYGEWPELSLAAGLASFSLLVWRRLRYPVTITSPALAVDEDTP